MIRILTIYPLFFFLLFFFSSLCSLFTPYTYTYTYTYISITIPMNTGPSDHTKDRRVG